MKLFLISVALMLASVEIESTETEPEERIFETEVCYGTLGCFSSEYPFKSPERFLSVVPQSPEQIKVNFLLYTRQNTATPLVLNCSSPFLWRNFTARPTKFLVHGYVDDVNGNSMWKDLANELLKHGDYNVIIVDWYYGNRPPYTQATANTRVVGALIAELIETIIAYINLTAGDFHIIGHSLGSHIAGYAGERVPGLGRITGLDPAGPYFEYTEPQVRLDEKDAVYVDIIHTDGHTPLHFALGTRQQSGHSDFFPNAGHSQPGCQPNVIQNFEQYEVLPAMAETVACSHMRSVRLYIECFNSPCPFVGVPCASEDDYNNNLCQSCSDGRCARMGLYADQNKPPNGQLVKYYLKTGDSSPHCRYHFTVTLKISSKQARAQDATSEIVVTGEGFEINTLSLTGNVPVLFSPGQSYSFYLMSPNDIGNVESVTFKWVHVLSLADLFPLDIFHPDNTLHLDEIIIYRLETNTEVRLCAGGVGIATGNPVTISTKC